MAFTPDELRQFKEALTDGIKDAFKNTTGIPNTDGFGRNIGDFSQPIDQTARNEYLKRQREVKQNDLLSELQDKKDKINSSNYSNLYKKLANKSLNAQINNIRNGGYSGGGMGGAGGMGGYSMKSGVINIGAIVKDIGDKVISILDKIWQIVFINQRNALQLAENAGKYNTSIAKANLNLTKKEFASIAKTLSTYSGLASENALSLYQQSADEALGHFQKRGEINIANMEFAAAEQKREADYIKNMGDAIGGAAQELGAAAMALGLILDASVVGSAAGVIVSGVGAVVSLLGSFGESIAKWWAESKTIDYESQEKSKERFQEHIELATGQFEAVKQVVDGFDEIIDNLRKYIIQNDTEYKKTGIALGFTGDAYASYARSISGEVSKIFGIAAKDMAAMMKGYENSAGRTNLMDAEDFNRIHATGTLYGIGDSQAASLYGAMRIFNVSVESGADSFGKMYNQVTKLGLSTTKFAKDLEKNLKLAEKHNFKSGVENMMKLTKWAAQTRFNLDSAASFSDSIMNGSLSDALEKSAKLQVLGGSAAIYSDPFSMLYEAGADVGSLAKRQAAMFSDITGTFNNKTGETDFSWYENRMIAARAAAAGMEPEDVKNMIRQNNRQGKINRLLKNSGFDDEMKLAIGNRAEFVKDKGWQVKTLNADGTLGTKSLDEISGMKPEELQKILLPENTEEGVIEIAARTRSIEEIEKAQLEYLQATKQGDLYGAAVEYSEANMKNKEKIYTMPNFVENAEKSMKAITNNNTKETEATIKFFKENGELISDYRKFVENSITDSKEISDLTKVTMRIMAEANGPKHLQELISKANEKYFATNLGERVKGMNELYQNSSATERRYLEAMYSEFKNGVFDYNNVSTNDGYGYTNGGVLRGASNVKSINDGTVNVKTASQDQYLAAMPNGPIDKILQQLIPGLQALLKGQNGNSGSNTLTLNGRIELSQDGSVVNLVEMIKDNPSASAKLITLLTKMMETNSNGKPTYSYKMF